MRMFNKKSISIKNAGTLCIMMLVALFLSVSIGDVYSQSTDTQKKRVTGTITDAGGEPLVGVTVRILNTTTGTITNIDGLYVIDVLESEVLTFSYVGYISQNLSVAGKSTLDVVLQEDTQMVEEIVVVGYGTQQRGAMVSSVTSISSKELVAPTSNLTNNLAGQLAGLISVQRSAEPGRDDAEFWIRGISTFRGGTTPLILVDGIPREISNIEPDEIESFSLLKDAAATAVYGAEGANGVILVTTKRGVISKPKISFRAEHSVASPQRVPNFVDSWQYLELANEALFNDGQNPYVSQAIIDRYRNNEDPDLYPNTNWMDELLDNNVNNQRYTMTFRGGAENAKYFVSMSYLQQDGVFKENPMGKYNSDFGYQRYNLRSNVDLKVSKTTNLSVNLSAQYINRRTANRSPDDVFSFMLHTPSHLFPAIYSDGTLATYEKQSDGNNRSPFNMLYNQGYRQEFSTKIQGNVGVDQDLSFITPGLSLNGKLGLDHDSNLATLRNYWPSLYNATGRDANGDLVFITSVSGSPELEDPSHTVDNSRAYRNIYIEGSINYARIFDDVHRIGGMLLYMQKENQQYQTVLPYRKQGLVGRVSYSYDDRYSIEANFGYTGSETFAANNRFGFFPAVGLAYYVSNESFYPEAIRKVMNSAKVRLSYGRTGNDNTGTARFLYRATFDTGGYNFNQGIGSNGGTNGLGAGIKDMRFENSDIQWEIEQKRNVGLDLGFFNNKIDITADYFNNVRSNILLERNTILSAAGFHAKPWANFGTVQNQGVDVALNARHNFGKVFVSARGTFTFARNKILEYDELPQEYRWQEVTGTRVNEHTVYIAERLYTEDDFIRTQNPINGTYSYELRPGLPEVALGGILGPGDIKYADLNNDGIIDSKDMQRGVGHPYNPEVNYGFGLNVEYKGFYISTFFQGTANTTILLNGGAGSVDNNTFWPFNWGIEKSNYRVDFLDRWTAEDPRQDVLIPRLHVGYANNINDEASTWWLKDGSFLRFKNLEFGYSIPKEYVKKIGIDACRVYLLGHNLHIWDKFKLWDPEMGNRNKGNSYPMSRTFTLGLELNF